MPGLARRSDLTLPLLGLLSTGVRILLKAEEALEFIQGWSLSWRFIWAATGRVASYRCGNSTLSRLKRAATNFEASVTDSRPSTCKEGPHSHKQRWAISGMFTLKPKPQTLNPG